MVWGSARPHRIDNMKPYTFGKGRAGLLRRVGTGHALVYRRLLSSVLTLAPLLPLPNSFSSSGFKILPHSECKVRDSRFSELLLFFQTCCYLSWCKSSLIDVPTDRKVQAIERPRKAFAPPEQGCASPCSMASSHHTSPEPEPTWSSHSTAKKILPWTTRERFYKIPSRRVFFRRTNEGHNKTPY